MCFKPAVLCHVLPEGGPDKKQHTTQSFGKQSLSFLQRQYYLWYNNTMS